LFVAGLPRLSAALWRLSAALPRLAVGKKRENSVADKKPLAGWGKPVAIRGFFSAL
jgi:hypothetical protein